jgi:hypothetical protein
MEPLSGAIVAPGGGPLALQPMNGRVALARICIGGPADGKVLVSSSTRLDYRTPSVTVLHDLDTGSSEVVRDVDPKFTYVPKAIQVLGVRQYRIWVGTKWWDELQQPGDDLGARLAQFEAEVVLRLIDAEPREIRACRELP